VSFSSVSIFLRLSLILSAASATVEWDDLRSKLSSEDILVTATTPSNWYDQCVTPFLEEGADSPVSNYQLLEKPSGICQDHVSCSYEECTGPYFDATQEELKNVSFYEILTTASSLLKNQKSFADSTFPKEWWTSDDRLNLPTVTVFPKHAGDISEAIKFAAQNEVGISVKTSGHSYTGSSTKKGTLLLNLSKLAKYSPDGSIVECEVDSGIEGAYKEACKLAIARDKSAIIRVGGGEIWDDAMRAVFFTWNENEKNPRKYHIVGGGAGTVSAAGGWLASGGLGGTTGMRLFGIGVDQVLHVEMVMPNGLHVRFGPTHWEHESGMMNPQTKKVTGYCNKGDDLSDEDVWDWEECDEFVFEDLWYAVRGGGGGTYGVVTSIYYQLHNQPNPYQLVSFTSPPVISADLSVEKFVALNIEFTLKFLFEPATIGVTELTSNSCSNADSGFFRFFCYNGAGDTLKAAFVKYLGSRLDNFDESTISSLTVVQKPSYAHGVIAQGGLNDGRVEDSPPPGLLSSFNTFQYVESTLVDQHMIFPADALKNKRDELVPMFAQCYLEGMWTLG